MSGYIGNIPVPQATQTRDVFTATAGQTSFATSGYTPGFLDVYLNGVKLIDGTDFTASNGSDVVLNTGAALDDTLEVIAFTTFEVNSQNFTGNTVIDNVDINGGTIDGTVIGGSNAAAITGTTITGTSFVSSGNMTFGDNDKAIFGAGSDLQIYHDGSHSYINDAGTGELRIQANGVLDINKYTGENMARFFADGEVQLYHNNVQKLATKSTGIDVTGTVTADGLGVAGYNTSLGVTAVDVFVYDTSKDSDGGAWRKRTQHTSWYNETLNTATRGSRREFPSVAVIVAEASKVTIYDGDDPDLPMWMVFKASGGVTVGTTRMYLSGAVTFTGVSMLNGKLAVTSTYSNPRSGIDLIDFLSDSGVHITNSTNNTVQQSQPIAQRNTLSVVVSYDHPIIVNNAVNDVAMTVLPNAPIDAATGLPVPTIAVATAGGVSVIKDDGTVVDLTYTASVNNEAGGVWFPKSGGIGWQSRSAAGGYVYTLVERTIPTADKSTAPDALYANFGQVNFVGNDLVTLGRSQPRNFIDGVVGSPNGLTLIDENPTAPANGMVAYVTSTYNTGWMHGDIKGAFLADTDDTDLVGSGELVTNGTFDSASNWTIQGDAINWTITGGVASGAAAEGSIYSDSFTTVAGETYVISFEVSNWVDGQVYASEAEDTGTGQYVQGDGTYSKTFIASDTSTYVNVRARPSDPFTGDIDNISVKLADADRSVNNNGLIVNGTVTRSPVATGAELVAYSGFSASNYLEQPYNSALDFGTGDFCVMGWVNPTAANNFRTIFMRGFHTGAAYSGAQISVGTNASTALRFTASDDGYATSDEMIGDVLSTNVWAYFCVVRSGNTFYLYQNDRLVDTQAVTAATGSLSNTSASAFFGNSAALSSAFIGSMALWRISATAPTAEQIKKIYEVEKVLFQENAAATLYGASDAVTALAHDEDTGLLHVGTSAGRSVFQGLRRVSNTTTAVGTAISASNGLVVEE